MLKRIEKQDDDITNDRNNVDFTILVSMTSNTHITNMMITVHKYYNSSTWLRQIVSPVILVFLGVCIIIVSSLIVIIVIDDAKWKNKLL